MNSAAFPLHNMVVPQTKDTDVGAYSRLSVICNFCTFTKFEMHHSASDQAFDSPLAILRLLITMNTYTTFRGNASSDQGTIRHSESL